jgi:exosortase family protein XrtM
MNRFILFVKSNARELKFFTGFILIFFILQTGYYFARPLVTFFLVDTLTSGVSSDIINIIAPREKTFIRNGAITDGTFMVEIRRGCEGIEGMLLLIAVVLSYPAEFVAKLYGLIGGILFIYVFNLARIVGLYYIVKYKPALFDMMHIYVGQIVIILVTLIYFILWLSSIEKSKRKSQ